MLSKSPNDEKTSICRVGEWKREWKGRWVQLLASQILLINFRRKIKQISKLNCRLSWNIKSCRNTVLITKCNISLKKRRSCLFIYINSIRCSGTGTGEEEVTGLWLYGNNGYTSYSTWKVLFLFTCWGLASSFSKYFLSGLSMNGRWGDFTHHKCHSSWNIPTKVIK